VLKGIDLTVDNSEFAVLLGPGLWQVHAAECRRRAGATQRRHGRDRHVARQRHRAQDRDIAMVFQSYALYPSMTVRRNITFGMECRGASSAQSEAVARVAASQIDGFRRAGSWRPAPASRWAGRW
jgi:multiple sugar transport system ATP-binding protein